MRSYENSCTKSNVVDIGIYILESLQQIFLVYLRNLWIMPQIGICMYLTEDTAYATILAKYWNISKCSDFHSECVKLFLI